MHMQNRHNPDSWVFLKGLITYSNYVLVDYNEATDGGQVREPQSQVWIDQQRNLDGSLRLFAEGRYSMAEFLICARQSTPTFGVIRPLHQAIAILPAAVFLQTPPQEVLVLLPLTDDQHQELQLVPILPATVSPQAPPQEAPALVPLHVDQHQDLIEIMRRILPRRPQIPVPQDHEEDLSNHQHHVIPSVIYVEREDLTITPIVEEKCYICLYSPPIVVAYPCLHQ